MGALCGSATEDVARGNGNEMKDKLKNIKR